MSQPTEPLPPVRITPGIRVPVVPERVPVAPVAPPVIPPTVSSGPVPSAPTPAILASHAPGIHPMLPPEINPPSVPIPAIQPVPHPPPRGGRKTYLLVDGENIDATLGMNVLGRRPSSDERPRWDRINAFAQQVWDQDVVPLFFLNASNGQMPMPFIQALLAMGYRPIPLAGSVTEKVVDIGIQRTLTAIKDRPGDVLLVSHDGDFAPQVAELIGPDRKVGLIAFREFVNAKFADLTTQGLDTFDLEADVQAFTTVLPRVRIIELDKFDPTMYL